MRISIVAVGRLKACAEAELTADYLSRAATQGRKLGFQAVELIETEARTSDSRLEAEALIRATPTGGPTVLLDERGADWTSRELALRVARWRDEGAAALTFWIGGADGADESLAARATCRLALGRLTWPHRLARVMVAEQIYRVVTILGASPYHRD